MVENKQEEALYNEKFDIEWDIFTKLDALIEAEWDSNTLKQRIVALLKQLHDIHHELDQLDNS